MKRFCSDIGLNVFSAGPWNVRSKVTLKDTSFCRSFRSKILMSVMSEGYPEDPDCLFSFETMILLITLGMVIRRRISKFVIRSWGTIGGSIPGTSGCAFASAAA